MIVREKPARSVLYRSRIYDYVINPYTGCAHACSYCYARFMRRFTGHREAWGEFVDVNVVEAKTEGFFSRTSRRIVAACETLDIACRVVS